jgi:predicted RNase H-like HicB family nuclease
MSELFFEITESDEGGYIARALGQSIFTEADTYEEIKQNIKEAVVCHFEEHDMPKLIRLHFVKDELLVV